MGHGVQNRQVPVERCMKRTISTLALFAFVLAGSVPCRAAFMSCGMTTPSAKDRCASCVADAGSGPVLTAGSCCSTEPGQDRSTAPAVLSGGSGGPAASAATLLATIPATAMPARGVAGSLVSATSGRAGPPGSPAHTTVLRL